MKELITMLERKVPSIRTTRTWRDNTMRWVRNYEEIKRLQVRKPEIFEAATIALVNHIAAMAQRELDQDPEILAYFRRLDGAKNAANREWEG